MNDQEKSILDTFSSLEDFLKSIEDHNKSIQGTVTFINEDNPLYLKLGWVCVESGQKWELPISQIRKWENDNNRGKIFRKCTVSMTGRELLCQKFSTMGK